MRTLCSLALLLAATRLLALPAADYLPADMDPDPSVPTPESVLGWNVGDWHVSHDRLVAYLEALAEASPRVSLREIGRSHEQRPLMVLTISSEDNQDKLESLRRQHLDGAGPLVVWLGYSVHGNEPSGSNAAMLAAWYLAASRSEFVRDLLAGSVIILDPSLNPDGLNRFASWANQNSGLVPVRDPSSRIHAENWPNGRTNHYLFDLNRDWLPLVHPESRARVSEYHRWLPHVLTDHHEQGGFPGFFFQPGVPSRQNPLTPAENLELTRALGQFHSEALDRAGQPYFTEEAFDDFYFGKGSTYPDINGTVGILFEQRAIRGQEITTSNGTETFTMAVGNQLRMTLSTLRGAWELRDRLKAYQAGFHEEMMERAGKGSPKAWVVGDDADPARAAEFLGLLDRHGIRYEPLGEAADINGETFSAGRAWVIPARQRQAGLLEAMMEQRTQFNDNTFYDVSAWTLPLAYNLPFAPSRRLPATGPERDEAATTLPPEALAWVIPWNQMEAAGALQSLLADGVLVRAARLPFSAQSHVGAQSFGAGSLVIQAGIQPAEIRSMVVEKLSALAGQGLKIFALDRTLTSSGPDLGSRHFVRIQPIRPLIVGGRDVSAYGAGEQWHLLDLRLGVPAPMVETWRLDSIDLSIYSHLLLADGSYTAVSQKTRRKITDWVRRGGTLVTVGRAAAWAEELCFESGPEDCSSAPGTEPSGDIPASRAYADFPADKAEQVVGGAIVASRIDLSHPLAFGYQRSDLPLFRRGTTVLGPSRNPYATPVRYAEQPLLAGFIGPDQLDRIRQEPAVIAERKGQGLVVRFANNPLFRGFWRGTERLFVNALYFGQVIEDTELPAAPPPPKPEIPRQH